MKKYFIIVALIFATTAPAITSGYLSENDFKDVTFSDNRGSAVEAVRGHVTYNIRNGWNLVPLKFLAESSGGYWRNYKENQSCDQDLSQNVWYYSPVQKNYYRIPDMDNWIFPKSRENDFLLNEFNADYYHVYAGSGWVYSDKDCIIEGDEGARLVVGTYNNELEGIGYSAKSLVLKAGWNFVPLDVEMVLREKSILELFGSCESERFYMYDQGKNKWVDVKGPIMEGKKITREDIFTTILMKTTKDCKPADYTTQKSSLPALPE